MDRDQGLQRDAFRTTATKALGIPLSLQSFGTWLLPSAALRGGPRKQRGDQQGTKLRSEEDDFYMMLEPSLGKKPQGQRLCRKGKDTKEEPPASRVNMAWGHSATSPKAAL